MKLLITDLVAFFITESFSLDNSDKTTSWVTSTCSTFCCKEFIVGISFIIDNNIKMYIFSHKTCYLTTVLMLLSYRVSINFFFLTYFLFFFLRTFYLTFFLNTFYLPPSILFPSFELFFVIFRMQRMLVMVSKLKHIYHGSHASWVRAIGTFLTGLFYCIQRS